VVLSRLRCFTFCLTTGISGSVLDASPLLDSSTSLQRAFPLGLQHDAGEFFSLLMEALKAKEVKRIRTPNLSGVQTRFELDVTRVPLEMLTGKDASAKPKEVGSDRRKSDGYHFGFDRKRDVNPFVGLEAHAPILCPECGPITDAR
jgi:hypothetical protein